MSLKIPPEWGRWKASCKHSLYMSPLEPCSSRGPPTTGTPLRSAQGHSEVGGELAMEAHTLNPRIWKVVEEGGQLSLSYGKPVSQQVLGI